MPPTVSDMARLKLPTSDRFSMETYSSMSMIMLVKKVQWERPLRNRIAYDAGNNYFTWLNPESVLDSLLLNFIRAGSYGIIFEFGALASTKVIFRETSFSSSLQWEKKGGTWSSSSPPG